MMTYGSQSIKSTLKITTMLCNSRYPSNRCHQPLELSQTTVTRFASKVSPSTIDAVFDDRRRCSYQGVERKIVYYSPPQTIVPKD